MAKNKKIEVQEKDTLSNSVTQDITPDEVQPVTITLKQELEALHAEMTRLGVNSIGQVEVKISQQK